MWIPGGTASAKALRYGGNSRMNSTQGNVTRAKSQGESRSPQGREEMVGRQGE